MREMLRVYCLISSGTITYLLLTDKKIKPRNRVIEALIFIPFVIYILITR